MSKVFPECVQYVDIGWYTWRHNNIVNYVVSCIDTSKYTVYSDLPGHTVGNGSIPADICITAQKPDIVIINQQDKEIHIFELSVCIEHYIEERHRLKSDKYAHFLTDISDYKCNVVCFEIGSRGFITERNHSHLSYLHKLSKPCIKRSKFKENIAALSIYSSYHIYLCRNDDYFEEPPFLKPPFADKWGLPTQT